MFGLVFTFHSPLVSPSFPTGILVASCSIYFQLENDYMASEMLLHCHVLCTLYVARFYITILYYSNITAQ